MKRKRKVILITCSVSVLALFVSVAWLKVNGEYYAVDRSWRHLSVGETARHLFSSEAQTGVMFVSAQFPRQRYNGSISQSKALKLLRHSSPQCESIFWADIDEVGPVGFFVERELGEVTMYCEHREFIFQILINDGNDLDMRHFGEGVSFPATQFMVFPEGLDFSNWEFRKEPSLESLSYFGRNSLPDPNVSVEEIAFHGAPLFQGKAAQNDGILIFFDQSAKAWNMMKWPHQRPLDEWKTLIAEEGGNQLD